jgi:ADP-heptose:LPS heptosyltransferase
LLKTLRTSHPNARIIFVTAKPYKQLLDRIGLVDEVLTINDKGLFALLASTISLVFKLWKRKIGLFLDLEIYSNYSTVITTASCARNRIGFYKESRHYRMGIYTHMMYFNIKAPISQVYLQMARVVGCRNIHEQLTAPAVTPEEIKSVQEKTGIKGGYVLVNPNASDLRTERRWSISSFKQLIRQLGEARPDLQVITIGAPNEVSYVDQVVDGIELPNLVNTAGKLNLPELFAIIRGADLVVTNDSGPMNIALATGKPTVGLFGPVAPEQYGSFEHCYPFYKNIYCSPCVHEFDIPPCKGDNQCMQSITVDEVFQGVTGLLSGQGMPSAIPDKITFETEIPLGVVQRKRNG